MLVHLGARHTIDYEQNCFSFGLGIVERLREAAGVAGAVERRGASPGPQPNWRSRILPARRMGKL